MGEGRPGYDGSSLLRLVLEAMGEGNLSIDELGRSALRRAQWDLERANAELLDLQRRQAELSSLIVHDLKSPLTTIIGTTEIMLEDQQASERTRDDLRNIQQAARSMHRMAMDL